MFKLIKWLLFIAIVAGIVLWITGYKVGGKTIQEHLKPVTETPMVKDAVRDIRSLLGEGLKAAGEAISEDITDSERKQLENVLKDELNKGTKIDGAPGQEALPPKKVEAAEPGAAPTQPVK